MFSRLILVVDAQKYAFLTHLIMNLKLVDFIVYINISLKVDFKNQREKVIHYLFCAFSESYCTFKSLDIAQP